MYTDGISLNNFVKRVTVHNDIHDIILILYSA